MSHMLFGETLDEVATYRRISKLEDPLYLLIDEFQYIFTDSILCNIAKQFFKNELEMLTILESSSESIIHYFIIIGSMI